MCATAVLEVHAYVCLLLLVTAETTTPNYICTSVSTVHGYILQSGLECVIASVPFNQMGHNIPTP